MQILFTVYPKKEKFKVRSDEKMTFAVREDLLCHLPPNFGLMEIVLVLVGKISTEIREGHSPREKCSPLIQRRIQVLGVNVDNLATVRGCTVWFIRLPHNFGGQLHDVCTCAEIVEMEV